MRNLSTRLILIAIATLYHYPSNANLIANVNSTLGSACYSEDSSDGGLRVMKCQCTGSNCPTYLPKCQQSYYSNNNEVCVYQTASNWIYLCGFDNACGTCNLSTSPSTWTWTTQNSANHVLKGTSAYYKQNGDWECAQSGTSTRYGCEASYYMTSNAPSSTMTCGKCPDGGTSDKGNTAITGCYIPANGDFSDDTGSGTVTSKCSYQK